LYVGDSVQSEVPSSDWAGIFLAGMSDPLVSVKLT